jgi:hypothetical protein
MPEKAYFSCERVLVKAKFWTSGSRVSNSNSVLLKSLKSIDVEVSALQMIYRRRKRSKTGIRTDDITILEVQFLFGAMEQKEEEEVIRD